MKKRLLYGFAVISTVMVLSMGMKIHAQETPKNIIVFISDGWGYNHIAATKYWHGIDSTSYEKFEAYHPMSTYSSSVKKMWEDTISGYTTGYNSYKAWTDWKWMKRENDGGMGATGSAPAATTMASGKKSTKYAIGMDIDSSSLELITEKAIEMGKAAGIVSSVQFAHATPAGFSAHNGSRKAYAEIARSQIIDSKLSVIMGCGNPGYDNDGNQISPTKYKYVGGQETWDSLKTGATVFSVAAPSGNTEAQDVDGDGNADAWVLVQDSADFSALKTGATPKRVIGVPKVASTLQQSRSGNYRDTVPFAVPYVKNIPRLHQMTTAALNVLDNNDNDKGFFLMVEGGAVDWAGHGNSLTRIIEEQTDFDMAVDSAIALLDAMGELENTLIIVTGDHETGYLTGPEFDTTDLDMVVQYPVVDSGKHKMPGYKFMSNSVYGEENYGEHTNQLIPFYATGPGAKLFAGYADQEDFVRGRYIDNTDMGHAMLELWNENPVPEPKNVFLFISDGWSYNHMKAADYFMGETPGYQSWDELYMSTYSATYDKNWETTDASFDAWYNPFHAWTDYNWIKRIEGGGATGSAPAATSMYTGYKTSKYAIGVDINGNPLKTFCERAAETGKSTGVVSSVQFAHATPAAMFAHNNSRKEYAEIANEMLLDSKASVIMGCGAPDYDNNGQSITPEKYKYVGGEGTWNNILAGVTVFDSSSVNGNNTVQDINGDGTPDAWTIVRDSAEFVEMAAGKTPLRVLGIPKVGSTLQYNRDNNDSIAFGDPFNKNVPTLADMTKAAINVLDNNDKGFAIMVEGGAVDWAGHGNDLDGVIEEQVDFNNAVEAAVQWVNDNSSWDESLIIVTGDHETGYLVGSNFDTTNIYETYPITDNGKDQMPGGKFLYHEHTNMLIPFYAKGVGSKIFSTYADHHDYYRKRYLDNTEIGQGIFKMWRGIPDGTPSIDPQSIISAINNDGIVANNVKVYPTVTTGKLKIEVENAPALVKVINLSGQVLKMKTLDENVSTLNLNGAMKGIYFVEIQTPNSKAVKKIILK